MPIRPAKQDKEAQEENLAALLLLVSAQQQDGSSIASVQSLVERWREVKKALKKV